jgi:hypothetical protein
MTRNQAGLTPCLAAFVQIVRLSTSADVGAAR